VSAVPIFPELEKALLQFAKQFYDDTRHRFDELKSIVVNKLRWTVIDVKKHSDTCKVVAADSSFTIVETRLGLIYVVQGVALAHGDDTKFIRIGDVGTIEFPGMYDVAGMRKIAPKKVLALYAQCVELNLLKQAVRYASEKPFVLIDGSAISFTMDRFKKVRNVRICSATYGCYSVGELVEMRLQTLAFLNRNTITLFIAKNSGASFYGIKDYPDLYVLELARLFKLYPYSESGFSVPIVLKSDELSRILKVEVSKLRAYELDTLIVTYMRLVSGGPAFQLSSFSTQILDTIEDIALRLAKIAPAGYPIPLELSHKLSKIDSRTIRESMYRLGVQLVSGREILE